MITCMLSKQMLQLDVKYLILPFRLEKHKIETKIFSCRLIGWVQYL